MSFFNFGGAPKKEAPAGDEGATGSGANLQETSGIAQPDAVQGVYTNNGEVLTETEAKEVIEKRKEEGWREQP
jgi:hypothetical protein